MSKYTTEVRFICETLAGIAEQGDYSSINEVIGKAREKIFDFDYPIFDENYRNTLENKILLHYYTQEIGQETYGLWKLRLQAKLNEIMPYYNQLYKSELLEFNPLVDVELETQRTQSGGSKSSGSNSAESQGTSYNDANAELINYGLFSDTPQGGLDGVDSETYLSSANKVKNTSTNSNTGGSTGKNSGSYNSEINNTDQYIEHIKGKNGGENYAKKLADFRKTFLNIDMQVIRDLRELFMYLW